MFWNGTEWLTMVIILIKQWLLGIAIAVQYLDVQGSKNWIMVAG